jgi:TRAP-type C4-dicarboxylate transport system substrate-binding protein
MKRLFGTTSWVVPIAAAAIVGTGCQSEKKNEGAAAETPTQAQSGNTATDQPEETVELKLSHFMPPKHPQHRLVMKPWTKEVGKASGGRLNVTIFPGGALGKPPHQYDAAAKGLADIAFGLHSYSPGRFPLISVMQLPFLIASGESCSRALWQLYEQELGAEFEDTKVLWLFCHGPGHLHTTKKQVKKLEDINGLKVRSPGPVMSKVLETLGAVPVNMPITQVYTALERGTIDGVAAPWEAVQTFRFHEQAQYATELGIYSLTFFVTMNKDKYQGLPGDLKKVIDEHSGLEMSVKAGKVYDDAEQPAKKLATGKGMQVYTLPDAEFERWKKAVEPVVQRWLKETEKGAQILESARALLGGGDKR